MEEQIIPNLDIKDFQSISSAQKLDHILMVLSNGVGAKVTIDLLIKILLRDIQPSINKDGEWVIGTTLTGLTAVGKNPFLQTSENGIEWKYEGETSLRPLVSYDQLRLKFSDLSPEQFQSLKLTLADLTPEEVAELQEPAINAIKRIEDTELKITKAEELRATAETSRATAETTRNSSETTRATNETGRVNTEELRGTAETNRATAETSRNTAESTRTTKESERQVAETARGNAEDNRVTAESNRVTKEGERQTAETTRNSSETTRGTTFGTLKTESETATSRAIETATHPTYVGDDHYVYVWNTTTKAYDKTDINVKGAPFSVKKTYPSVALMEADFIGTDTVLGDFVLIETEDVENPDNSKLYVKTETKWSFLTDMSGAIGFTGKTPQFSIGVITTVSPDVPASVTLSEDGVDTSGNPKYKINLALPKGEGLDYNTMTPEEKENIKGMSAYEVAVEDGYSGTKQQWLISLIGANGLSAYALAIENGFVGSVEEWLLSLKGAKGNDGVGINGADGLSAYQVAVNNGFSGTVGQWLVSLKGDDGTFDATTEFAELVTTNKAIVGAINEVNGKSFVDVPNDGNNYVRKNGNWNSFDKVFEDYSLRLLPKYKDVWSTIGFNENRDPMWKSIRYDEVTDPESGETIVKQVLVDFNYTTIPDADISDNHNITFNSLYLLIKIPRISMGDRTSMDYMFHGCSKLTTIPLLDTSKVTSMYSMFHGCSNLTTIPLLDTSKVTNMYYMFQECSNLTTIPLLDTSKVTSMNSMFQRCSKLTTIPLLDTSKVTNMYYVFLYCSNLKICNLKGLKADIDFTTSPLLTRESIIYIFENAQPQLSTTKRTITLGMTNLAKLTLEEKAIATSKNFILR